MLGGKEYFLKEAWPKTRVDFNNVKACRLQTLPKLRNVGC